MQTGNEINLKKKKDNLIFIMFPFLSFKVTTVLIKKDFRSSNNTQLLQVQRVYFVSDLGIHLYHILFYQKLIKIFQLPKL